MKNILTKVVIAAGLGWCLIGAAHSAVGDKFSRLEDAAVAQAKVWQSGGKARPLMSSDGKIVFAYGQSFPTITCSPARSCDIEMQPGEKVKKVAISDTPNWGWDAAESEEHGNIVQHVIIQPHDVGVESNAIIFTNRRTYHIRLLSPKEPGDYLNRVGFYYPEEMLTAWSEKMGVEAAASAKDESGQVTEQNVPLENLAFDYKIEGEASFRPIRIFSNGEQVYMEMPESVRNGENPVLLIIDDEGKAGVVNYRRKVDKDTNVIHYVVDKLFANAQLVLGKGKEIVKISWLRKQKKSFWGSN
jgi:P-type conjugative transfer protein TrbG